MGLTAFDQTLTLSANKLSVSWTNGVPSNNQGLTRCSISGTLVSRNGRNELRVTYSASSYLFDTDGVYYTNHSRSLVQTGHVYASGSLETREVTVETSPQVEAYSTQSTGESGWTPQQVDPPPMSSDGPVDTFLSGYSEWLGENARLANPESLYMYMSLTGVPALDLEMPEGREPAPEPPPERGEMEDLAPNTDDPLPDTPTPPTPRPGDPEDPPDYGQPDELLAGLREDALREAAELRRIRAEIQGARRDLRALEATTHRGNEQAEAANAAQLAELKRIREAVGNIGGGGTPTGDPVAIDPGDPVPADELPSVTGYTLDGGIVPSPPTAGAYPLIEIPAGMVLGHESGFSVSYDPDQNPYLATFRVVVRGLIILYVSYLTFRACLAEVTRQK